LIVLGQTVRALLKEICLKNITLTQAHQNRHRSIANYDFLLTFYSNHRSFSYRFPR